MGLKPKMYSFLVHDSSQHKKAKCSNKNAVARKSHNKMQRCFVEQKMFETFDE